MDIKEIRQHLDRLDEALVLILAERQSLIPLVAEYKKRNNIDRYQPEREKEIISEKRKLAESKGLNPDLIESIIKSIIEDSHRIQRAILKR